MVTIKHTIYEQTINVMSEYLGPAAVRFIDRHIQNHLQKEPKHLKASDMHILIDWIKISFAFLTEDRKVIDDIVHRLLLIADKNESQT